MQSWILRGLIFLSLFATTSGFAGEANSPAKTLLRAERSFAALSLEQGIAPAFRHWLADSSIIFRPHPVNGKQWFQGKQPKALLAWEPRVVGISASGDFGYTTGPWTIRKSHDDDTISGRGHFVSIWKKQSNGEWRVVFDHGIQYDAPFDSIPVVIYEPSNHIQNLSRLQKQPLQPERVKTLLQQEALFSENLKSRGTVYAYEMAMARKVWILRDGFTPVFSFVPVEQFLRKYGAIASLSPIGCEVAESDDLGYTYGKLKHEQRQENDPLAGEYYYLRIWQRNEQWRWQIVLEIATPVPPAEDVK